MREARRTGLWTIWMMALALTLGVPARWSAAQEEARETGTDVEEGGGEEPLPEFALAPDADIDRLLRGELEILAGEGSTYEAGDRPDPFASLLRRQSGQIGPQPRPEGVPGVDIDDLVITGIFLTEAGPVAQIRSSRENRSYLIREGDQLWDGEVVRISVDEVELRQRMPNAIKPFREVVKRLSPE